MSTIDKFRQTEYTGENRCYPCTLVNITISIIIALAVSDLVNLFGGIFALIFLSAIIYLRGYVIPGTPSLTKQYFPKRVLRWFGKTPSIERSIAEEAKMFRDAGLIEYCDDRDDLRLTHKVRDNWQKRARRLNLDTIHERLESITESDEVEINNAGDRTYVIADGEIVMHHQSQLALTVDIAIYPILQEKCRAWDSFSLKKQSKALKTLRIFMETCPVCDSDLSLNQTSAQSCCMTKEVYSLSCPLCEVKISEI